MLIKVSFLIASLLAIFVASVAGAAALLAIVPTVEFTNGYGLDSVITYAPQNEWMVALAIIAPVVIIAIAGFGLFTMAYEKIDYAQYRKAQAQARARVAALQPAGWTHADTHVPANAVDGWPFYV